MTEVNDRTRIPQATTQMGHYDTPSSLWEEGREGSAECSFLCAGGEVQGEVECGFGGLAEEVVFAESVSRCHNLFLMFA